jgi:predicted GH43/DUF377 family glycosyl hydrolase
MKSGSTIRIFAITAVLLYVTSLVFSQTTWYKYPGNPVFFRGGSGEFDFNLFNKAIVLKDSIYHMWYSGQRNLTFNNSRIGYATSQDGIYWKKYDRNPIKLLEQNPYWYPQCQVMDVIWKDSLFYMWFRGIPREDSTVVTMGMATSVDGLNWKVFPAQVLKPGTDGAWDDLTIYTSVILFDGRLPGLQGKIFHMWYAGMSDTLPSISRVGYAHSNDGIHWKKYPSNPIIDIGKPGSWEDYGVCINSVIYNGSFFEMWYTGNNYVQNEIGYATSLDGINWKKSEKNPIIQLGEPGTWDGRNIDSPEVIFCDSVYMMWFNAARTIRNRYGFATNSVALKKQWDTLKHVYPKGEIRYQIFNKVRFIEADSLIDQLQNLSGTRKVDVYNQLAMAYAMNNREKSLYYVQEAIALASTIEYAKGKAMALYCLSNIQYIHENYSEALSNQLKALRLFDSLQLKQDYANLLCQIGGIYAFTGLNEIAAEYYREALNKFIAMKDSVAVRLILLDLGNSYLMLCDTLLARETFQLRLNYSKKMSSLSRVGNSYRNMGISYAGINTDSSAYYYRKAQKIFDTISYEQKGKNYLFTGEAFLMGGPQYYSEAEKCYLQSYEVYKTDGGKFNIRLCYRLAELYFLTDRLKKCKEYLDIAEHLCHRHLSYHEVQMYVSLNSKLSRGLYFRIYMEKIYQLYFRYDTAINNDAAAWKHLTLANQWKDSIYNQQNRRQWAMLQGQYETETANRKIDVLEKENEVKDLRIQQTRIYLFALGGFILIIVFMALLFVRQNKIRTEHNTVILEQKLLRLQMNPHFIFNALSNILNFVNRKDTTNAANYLTSFSRLLRTTLESSREDYIVLEDEISSIKNYLDLQLLRYEGKFDYSIDVDEQIDKENSIIPPMLIQPFIENAIEHGIKHKETKGNIIVRFKLENKKVICEVEDDGVGREKAWETEYQKRKNHKSLATEIIKDRIQSLNKKLKQKINLSIIDLKTETNEPIGTRVVLNIPYLID